MITGTGCNGALALFTVLPLWQVGSIFCNQPPSLASKTTWPASVVLSCDQDALTRLSNDLAPKQFSSLSQEQLGNPVVAPIHP